MVGSAGGSTGGSTGGTPGYRWSSSWAAAVATSSVSSRLPATDLFVQAALPDGGTLPILVVDPLAVELTPSAADEEKINVASERRPRARA